MNLNMSPDVLSQKISIGPYGPQRRGETSVSYTEERTVSYQIPFSKKSHTWIYSIKKSKGENCGAGASRSEQSIVQIASFLSVFESCSFLNWRHNAEMDILDIGLLATNSASERY